MAVVTDGQLFITEQGESLAGSDLVEVQRGTSVFAAAGTVENIQRPLVRSYIDRQAPAAGLTRYWTTTFTSELRGTNGTPTAANFPEVDQLLKAAGLTQSYSSDVHTYDFTANPNATPYSVSARFEESMSGNYYVSSSSNYTFTISGNAENLVTVAWTGTGEYNVPIANATPGSLTAATANAGPPMLAVDSYSLAGASSGFVIRDWSITGGLTVTPRLDAADSNGYAWPAVISRDAATSISITIEALSESAAPMFAGWAAANTGDINLNLVSGSRGVALKLNSVSLGAPVLQQGTPNMFSFTGAASTDSAGSTSSLSLEFT